MHYLFLFRLTTLVMTMSAAWSQYLNLRNHYEVLESSKQHTRSSCEIIIIKCSKRMYFPDRVSPSTRIIAPETWSLQLIHLDLSMQNFRASDFSSALMTLMRFPFVYRNHLIELLEKVFWMCFFKLAQADIFYLFTFFCRHLILSRTTGGSSQCK